MSLTYQSEHLAWQQRVKQEHSRSYQFYNTFGTFSVKDLGLYRPLFPYENQYSKSSSYKTFDQSLNNNKQNINHALTERILNHSPSLNQQKSLLKIRKNVSSSPRKTRNYSSPQIKLNGVKKAVIENQNHGKLNKLLNNNKIKVRRSDSAVEIYIKELEERLKNERIKRINTEIKLVKFKKIN